IGGILNTVKLTTTKKTGERMAIAKLEDLTGIVEVLVFPKSYTKIGNHIKADTMLFIRGRLSLREEAPKIIAEEAMPLNDVQDKMTKAISIKVITSGLSKKTLESLKIILSNHKGEVPAYIHFQTPENKKVALAIGADFKVRPSAEVINEIEELLGNGAVTIEST
ncbi:MAG: OB-fold nucleic acid binding domain-containing protein, partial [Candidatus Omnitrophota bacterium]|nr:OB-fold nucleic acid binding domain-containing protein [Candidatus Omnitrophota bacterium]